MLEYVRMIQKINNMIELLLVSKV